MQTTLENRPYICHSAGIFCDNSQIFYWQFISIDIIVVEFLLLWPKKKFIDNIDKMVMNDCQTEVAYTSLDYTQ